MNIQIYYSRVDQIDKQKLPDVLQKGYEYIDSVTKKGNDLSSYRNSDLVKKTIDVYLEKIEKYIQEKTVKKPTPRKTRSVIKKPTLNVKKVELLSDELKFIKRYVNLHNKAKTKRAVQLFISALQKAIVEKRIRKTSSHAKEILDIQDSLIKLLKKFKSSDIIQVTISASTLRKYNEILGKSEEYDSVKLIKEFIRIQGKPIDVKKAKSLHNKIARKINSNRITSKDKYWGKIQELLKILRVFVEQNHIGGELQVSSLTLKGFEKVTQNSTARNNKPVRNRIMSSTDIINLNFHKLGFKGKWLKLIGDPSKGFKAMIFGKPKMGKSYLAVDFAGYLARNHGTVLYVAREEGIDDTLQQKLKDKKVAHPDLYVSDYLPEYLNDYDFVFLDSVNKLGLAPEDLEELSRSFPNTSFINIFQTTKLGNFRGGNEFQHDVDVVIEVPEKGKAVQFGRFNQGGEVNIFS